MVGCLLCWTQCPILPAGKAYWHLINAGTTHWCRWFFCSCHIKYGFIGAPWLGWKWMPWLIFFASSKNLTACLWRPSVHCLPWLWSKPNFLWGCFILIRPHRPLTYWPWALLFFPRHPDLQTNDVVTLTSQVKDGSCRDSTPFHSGTQTFPRVPHTFRIPPGFFLFPLYPSPYLTTSRTVNTNRCPIIHRLAQSLKVLLMIPNPYFSSILWINL